MACPLPCRKAPDGTVVKLIVPDDVEAATQYFVAQTMQPWSGDPSTLKACACAPQEVAKAVASSTFQGTAATTASTFGLTVSQAEAAQVGDGPFDSIIPDPRTSPLVVPVPAHSANCVLALHVLGGGDGPVNSNVANLMGDMVAGNDTASLGSPVYYSTVVAPSHTNQVILFQGSGSTGQIELTAPNHSLEAAGSGFLGVISTRWVIICPDDGGTLSPSDFSSPLETPIGDMFTTNPLQSPEVVVSEDCPGVSFIGGRHTMFTFGAETYGTWVQTPSDFIQYDDASIAELYDLTSWVTPAGQPCQMGLVAAYVPAGADYVFTGESNKPKTVWNPAQINDIYMGLASCEREGGDGVQGKSEVCTVSITSECDDSQQLTFSYAVDLSVVFGTGATQAVVTPVINGTAIAADAQTVSSSGALNFTGTSSMGTLAAGATQSANICFTVDAVGGPVGVEMLTTGEVKLNAV